MKQTADSVNVKKTLCESAEIVLPAGIERIMREPAVLEATGWSSSTLWEKIKTNRFPKPMKLDPSGHGRAVGWFESTVREYQRTIRALAEPPPDKQNLAPSTDGPEAA